MKRNDTPRWARLLTLCALAGVQATPTVFPSAVAADSPEPTFVRGTGPHSAGILSPGMTLYELVNFYRIGQGLPAIDPRVEAPRNPDSVYGSARPAAAARWSEAAAPWSSATWMPSAWVAGDRTQWPSADWINCPSAAYTTAVETLHARARTNDATWVSEWVYGQNLVFQACGGTRSVDLPAAAPAHAPLWFVKDRAYQRAASMLYQQRFADAASAFDAIARDADSPWRDWGHYMAGRAWLRMANADRKPENWARASSRFEAVIADPTLSKRHRSARALLRMIAARSSPESTIRQLARALSGPIPDEDAAGVLRDFRWLWKQSAAPEIVALQSAGEDLLAWIHVAVESAQRSRGAWDGAARDLIDTHRSRTEVHWRLLVAAWDVEMAPLDLATRGWLAGIDNSMPHFHAARWLLVKDAQQRGDLKAAEDDLRSLALRLESFSASERELVSREMIAYVRNRTEMLRFGVTWSVSSVSIEVVEFDPATYRTPELVMRDEANTLVATLPAREILALARDASFPAGFRREALKVAWLRAMISEKHAVALEASREIVSLFPPMELRHAAFLYISARTLREKQEALMTALERGQISPIPFAYSSFAWCTGEIVAPVAGQRDPGWRALSSVSNPQRVHYLHPASYQANRVDSRRFRYPGALGKEWLTEQRALWHYDNGSVVYARLALPRIAAGPRDEDHANRLKRVRGVLRGGCRSLNPALNEEWHALGRWADVLAQTHYRAWNPALARRTAMRSWVWMARYRYLPKRIAAIDELLNQALPLRTN